MVIDGCNRRMEKTERQGKQDMHVLNTQSIVGTMLSDFGSYSEANKGIGKAKCIRGTWDATST